MSFVFAEKVMKLKLDPNDKNFPKILSTQQAIASSILTATARMRDGLVKPKGDDDWPMLQAMINAAEEADPRPSADGVDLFS